VKWDYKEVALTLKMEALYFSETLQNYEGIQTHTPAYESPEPNEREGADANRVRKACVFCGREWISVGSALL
jgi:hypothetical protein